MPVAASVAACSSERRSRVEASTLPVLLSSSSTCDSSRSACSARLTWSTSVFVPNQRSTWPWRSRTGFTRVRNQRYLPSAPRIGYSISNGSPLRMLAVQRSRTVFSTLGSQVDSQPQPTTWSGVVPV
jgi:hypothetical protein